MSETNSLKRLMHNAAQVVLLPALLLGAPALMAQPGTVLSHQKISDTEGGFTGTLGNSDQFGTSVASLGDLDGDGVGDLAVGAWFDDDGGTDRGAVWILFLNTDGTVNSEQKISDTQGGFTGTLDDRDRFGLSAAWLGDHDGDGVGDLAVGAIFDDDGGDARGAVWMLFLGGVACDPCDVNCDAAVDVLDVGPFVCLLLDPNCASCSTCAGDADGDGEETNLSLAAMEESLTPQVLETFDQIAATYLKVQRLETRRKETLADKDAPA